MSSNLTQGDFANPHNIVGAYSASAAATQTTPNFEVTPNRFSNDLVYAGPNTYGGTASNVQSANGKYVRLAGGKKCRAKKGGYPTGNSSNEETGSTGGTEPAVTDANDTALNEHGEPCRLCELGDESEHIDPSQLCSACKRGIYGGGKLFARNIKMNGGTKLGMDLKNPSASLGTVGAGHPGHVAVDLSAKRPHQPTSRLAQSALEGGRRRRGRTKNKRSRKMKKTKRHNRKTRGRKSHKKRHTRKRRKMRGGGCGCAVPMTGGSRKNRRSRRKRRASKKRGGGCGCNSLPKLFGGSSCGSHYGKKKMKGGSPQPFSNQPLSFGYTIDDAGINADSSALASPMPHKSYFACEKVARN